MSWTRSVQLLFESHDERTPPLATLCAQRTTDHSPPALCVALFGKRVPQSKFPCAALPSVTNGLTFSQTNSADSAATPSAAPQALSVAALSSPSSNPPPLPVAETPTIHEDDMKDILDQIDEVIQQDISAVPSDENNHQPSPTEGKSPQDTETTPEELEEEEEEDFDVREHKYYFTKLRDTTGYCSDKISRFIQEMWEELGDSEAGRLLLGRDAMAAPAVPINRKRRLFGEKEPELHQRVLGVLNKVTDDDRKYREIKNELMRLPLPEANPQSLEQVVKVFFAKAVREQRFSSHYADLVEEICRVPPGQAQPGDKTESLTYRLRVALLQRCQQEFLVHKSLSELPTVDAESGRTLTRDELEGIRVQEKKKLCGNVKFVGELFLRKMVSPRIIQMILCKLLCGTENTAVLQQTSAPTYIPEEYDCDQLITLLMTTGETFGKSEIGRQTLDGIMKVVHYFSQCHPVLRTKYLLLNLLDDAKRGFSKKTSANTPALQNKQPQIPVAAPAQHAPQEMGMMGRGNFSAPPTIAQRPAAVQPPPTPQPVEPASRVSPPPITIARRPDNAALAARGDEKLPQTPAKGSSPLQQSSASPQPSYKPTALSPSKSLMVPAPRSANGGGTPLSNQSAGRLAASTQPAAGSPIPAPRSSNSPPPSPQGPPTSAPSSTTPATVELIAPLMTKLSTSEEYVAIAHEIASSFDVRSALDVWIQRSLSVIKAEPMRRQIASLLAVFMRDFHFSRESLRTMAKNALQVCIEKRMYQDEFKLWKYWAQIVAGDATSAVLDDNLHNDVLLVVLHVTSTDGTSRGANKDTVREFIADVIATERDTFKTTSRFTSEAVPYTRFRPLNVLTNFDLATSGLRSFVADILNTPKIAKLQDVELVTYLGLTKGKPAKEELRTLYNADDRMRHVLTPAKVLSAIYNAEYAFDGKSIIDENLDLLQFVIDHALRHLRELALVLELYSNVKGITATQRSMNEGQRWIARLKLNRVVTEETHNAAHRLLAGDTDAGFAIGPSKNASAGAFWGASSSTTSSHSSVPKIQR